MNEPKSSRYHRLQRWAGLASLVASVGFLVFTLWLRPSFPLWAQVLWLGIGTTVLTFPIAYYRGVILERRYELSSESPRAWLKDQLKGTGITLVIAVAAAEFVYALVRWSPAWWWIPAAVGASLFTIVLARLAPVLLLPLFYRFTPLERPELRERLLALCQRAGVNVLGIYEWALGAKTRRANAALTGTGRTRRILLSDTLLADYSDDEIEVILAHELAHHVHRDIPKGLAAEFLVLTLAFLSASVVLPWGAVRLGLDGPADPRGLALMVICAGFVALVSTPLVNALSRHNERRADAFALRMTDGRGAFVSAMRRLGTQNLSEENPSRLTVLLFHSHPPIEERVAAAHRTAG